MLRIVHLEDVEDDAFIVERALARDGLPLSLTRAQNREEFLHALESPTDLILADGGLPGFDGLEALALARQKFPEVGFICVSGAGDPDYRAQMLSAGANDFILKDELSQLGASVRREHERLRLAQKNKGMALLVKVVQDLSLARDVEGIMAIVRRAARELTGADGATFVLKDGEFCFYADEDAIEPLWKGQRFPLTKCISGWAMLNGVPAVIEDVFADERIPIAAYRPTFVKSLAMVPIRVQSPIGAIGNYWATRRQPTAEEVELLQALANTTSVAFENVKVYQELEERVRERTAQLEFANKELETFSYAVSHDLTAPLRAIRSYNDMALEEFGAVLPEGGKRYLEKVRASSGRMGELIADLLKL